MWLHSTLLLIRRLDLLGTTPLSASTPPNYLALEEGAENAPEPTPTPAPELPRAIFSTF